MSIFVPDFVHFNLYIAFLYSLINCEYKVYCLINCINNYIYNFNNQL